MKKVNLLSGILGVFLTMCMFSCIETSYDDISMEVEFSPNGFVFPIGNIDTIYLGDLAEIDEVYLPEGYVKGVIDTLDLFNEEVIDKFFYPGGGDVAFISDSAKMQVGLSSNGVFAQISFEILDADYRICKDKQGNEVNIAPIDLVSWGKAKRIEIRIKEEDMDAMQTARYIVFKYMLGANEDFQLVNKRDFVYFKRMKLQKTGGVHFSF